MQYRSRRRVTSFDVTLETDWGRRNASIVDVTDKGARVRLEVGNLEPESEVLLRFCDRAYKARVIWNKEGEAGLGFENRLSAAAVGILSRSTNLERYQKKKRFLM